MFKMVRSHVYHNATITNLSFTGIAPHTLSLAPPAPVLARNIDEAGIVVPGAIYVGSNLLRGPPSPYQAVRVLKVDGWVGASLSSAELKQILLRFGNVSSADSYSPEWYEPHILLIGLNNVEMYSPKLSATLQDQLDDARNCLLETLLKEIVFGLLIFGQKSRQTSYYHPDQGDSQVALLKVLVAMLHTYVKIRVDRHGRLAIDSQDEAFCLLSANVEETGIRVEARRCIDNKKLEYVISRSTVARFPGFSFDDRHFHGLRPVPTWTWFSSDEAALNANSNQLEMETSEPGDQDHAGQALLDRGAEKEAAARGDAIGADDAGTVAVTRVAREASSDAGCSSPKLAPSEQVVCDESHPGGRQPVKGAKADTSIGVDRKRDEDDGYVMVTQVNHSL
jgi:hypothetical protein